MRNVKRTLDLILPVQILPPGTIIGCINYESSEVVVEQNCFNGFKFASFLAEAAFFKIVSYLDSVSSSVLSKCYYCLFVHLSYGKFNT